MDEKPFTVDDICHAVSGDTSLLRDLSSWERWNSAGAKAARKESGWIEGLRGKAQRLILAPIIEQFRIDGEGWNLAALGKAAVELRPSIHSKTPEFEYGFSALGASLCYRPPTDMQLVRGIFADRGAFSEDNNIEVDADPHNFLHFVLEQVGWYAAREGWAICIAEDGIATGDGAFSWIDPKHIPPMPEPGRIMLPEALGVKRWGDLEERLEREVGADRIWFVLTRDLIAFLDNTSKEFDPMCETETRRLAANVDGILPVKTKKKRDKDDVFISEGLQFIADGACEKAHEAARELVNKHGWAVSNFKVKDRGKIKAASEASAIERLSKKLGKALKVQ